MSEEKPRVAMGRLVCTRCAALSARVAELEEGLRPFANVGAGYDERLHAETDAHVCGIPKWVRVSDFRRAKALLEGNGDE